MAGFTDSRLTPTDFLLRSARVFPTRLAIVDGLRSFTYEDFAHRAGALTGVLAELDVGPGDRVAAMCANSHVMLELHHGVPMRGAVLVPLNVRLSESELTYIVEHSGAKIIFATHEFAETAKAVAQATGARLVVESGEGGDKYEELLCTAEPAPARLDDERALLAINYTSGTTGRPKGVMYHHRGAYLQALAMAFHTQLTPQSRYLWTLPMFHCNGWCFTWAVCAAGGTHVCLRAVEPERIWPLLRTAGVTHYSAAPTVLGMIADSPQAADGPTSQPIRVQTGGAPPSPALLTRLELLNMDVTHLYGLTETYGPIAINEWHPEWDELRADERAALKARQGVANVIAQPLRVVDVAGADVAADGQRIGEILARGNDVMLGYYRDEDATREAEIDGWLRTGDLAVMHSDGYVEIRDRAKDIIISGGENIASVEVERALESHPSVLEAAVVGVPDDRWGHVPVAFVSLRPGAQATAAELILHVRSRLAHFKAPKSVTFRELPKTSTGKLQKSVLRTEAAAG
jgi:fatty-acyl-CoA synthase